MELRPLTADEFAAWDEAVLSCPAATLFHTTTWLAVGGKAFTIYGAFDGMELIGGFVAEYEKLKNDVRISARSRLTPYSGQAVFLSPSKRSSAITARKAVAELAAERLKRDLRRVNVRLSPYTPDVQPYLWAGYTAAVRYTYLVDVSCAETVWANLDENHRRSIKQAEKSGLTVDVGVRAKDCVELFRASRESPAWWEDLLASYTRALSPSGMCRTFGIRDSDGALASAIFLVCDRYRSYYMLGGYRQQDDRISRAATTFGLWEAMRYTREELGLKTFDLEGSMIPGVELFFRKFGGELTPFYTISWGRAPSSASGILRRAVGLAARFSGVKKG